MTNERPRYMFVEICYRYSNRAVAKDRQDSQKLEFVVPLA